MPPFVPKKRRLSTPVSDAPTPKPSKKRNLQDTADRTVSSKTLQDNKAFIDSLNVSDNDSALSVVSSVEFEDALSPPDPKKQKQTHQGDEEGEIDWEDAIPEGDIAVTTDAPDPSEHLEITFDQTLQIGSLTNPHDKKKGPSKIERQIRTSTHCMHVQFLLFHNLIRNGWACDKEVQETLVAQLPPSIKNEVERWKLASGVEPEAKAEEKVTPARRGRKDKKAAQNKRNERDWGKPAERQENGVPNMSHGDPIFRLLKMLAAYWRKRFTITTPSLRKQGYKPLAVLEGLLLSWRENTYDMEECGEEIKTVEDFRRLAKICEGSRDLGAQLFTALIRGLGLEARLVASLQPVGFGWNKSEEAAPRKLKTSTEIATVDAGDHDNSEDHEKRQAKKEVIPPIKGRKDNTKKITSTQRTHRRGGRDAPVTLSEGSSAGSEEAEAEPSDSEGSVIDVTPATPRQKSNAKYDRDMVAPTYWTEVISSITNKVHPVDPMMLSPAVVTSPDHLAQFEPRGAKAEKAKQVFAYVIAYSSDGTAKEVTTRYLKRHMWPGRTKGVRLPVEKVPIHNRKGKIKRYEQYDWFKAVMSGYERPHTKRTAVDDLEETTSLKSMKPEKKDAIVGEETLQGYKTSAEFVLRRHLRREEALRPEAVSVKTFAVGKGDNAQEEPVYLRKDVEICRTSESWHKEGRAVKTGEHPMKKVPVRAVTMNRKREVEEAERDGGEKLMQGMYARDQTDWIIPPPIEHGVIPKNAYGNMDCYVPTMVPKGAVHIPLRSTVRICKRLGIDYAEAVTGFEFGKRMAVPVITGVVVAEENEHAVVDQWEKDEEERRIKEEGKREKRALATWRKWLMGLRIIQRVKEEYGNDAEAYKREDMNPFTNQSKAKKGTKNHLEADAAQPDEDESQHQGHEGGFMQEDDDLGGGFLPEGQEMEELPIRKGELISADDTPATNGNRGLHPTAAAPDEDGPSQVDNAKVSKVVKSVSHKDRTKMKKVTKSPALVKRGGKRKSSPKPQANGISTRELPHGDHEGLSRPTPNRRSARASTTAAKNLYFEQDSDEGFDNEESAKLVDSSDSEDEKLFEPTVKKRRGRPSLGKVKAGGS